MIRLISLWTVLRVLASFNIILINKFNVYLMSFKWWRWWRNKLWLYICGIPKRFVILTVLFPVFTFQLLPGNKFVMIVSPICSNNCIISSVVIYFFLTVLFYFNRVKCFTIFSDYFASF